MATDHAIATADDPFNLDRFVKAQEVTYETALGEIRRGRKESHWMWYVFPQFNGLGFSETSKHFAIKSVSEAEEYLHHPILGQRLLESFRATLEIEDRSAAEIFGSPDDLKLLSCATLFSTISDAEPVFEQLILRFFSGKKDKKTLSLLLRNSA